MKRLHWPILLGVLLLLLILFIVARRESSPISSFTQWISSHIEGFAAPIGDTPKCPTNYKFFNDKRGESFCCAGTVNPYTHVCDSKATNGLCSFLPGVVDPRTGTGQLPLCSSMIAQTTATAQEKHCPGKFPNYASIGKCCRHDSDMDGLDCTSLDKDPKDYCVIAGTPLKAGEQSCATIQMAESSFCPTALTKISYTLGAREVEKYGSAALGQTIPVCFGMDSTCIPDSAIKSLQSQGIFTGKGKWSYACSFWKKVHEQRDLTVSGGQGGAMNTSYP